MSSTRNPQVERKATGVFRNFMSGVIGSTCGVIVTCPLELVKTRHQSTFSARYGGVNGVVKGLQTVVRNEGILSLWKGCGLMILSVAPSRGIHFLVYESSKGYLDKRFPKLSPTLNALCRSILAGATAVTFCNPVWVVKTRIQLQNNVEHELISIFIFSLSLPSSHASTNKRFKDYGGIMDAIRRIYREEGIKSFFRGLSVSYLGLTETAIQFTCYDMLKRRLNQQDKQPSKLTLFLTAALSKLIATTLTYPHEVVRTRMRERTVGNDYANIVNAFKSVYKQSGMRGMYAGYEAHVCRTVPNAAIMFLMVEILLNNSL